MLHMVRMILIQPQMRMILIQPQMRMILIRIRPPAGASAKTPGFSRQ